MSPPPPLPFRCPLPLITPGEWASGERRLAIREAKSRAPSRGMHDGTRRFRLWEAMEGEGVSLELGHRANSRACLSKTPDMGRCKRNHHTCQRLQKMGEHIQTQDRTVRNALVHSILASDEYTETMPGRLERRVYIRLPLAANDDQRREPKAK